MVFPLLYLIPASYVLSVKPLGTELRQLFAVILRIGYLWLLPAPKHVPVSQHTDTCFDQFCFFKGKSRSD